MRQQHFAWLIRFSICNALLFYLIALWYAFHNSFFGNWLDEGYIICGLLGQFGLFTLIFIIVPGLILTALYPRKWFTTHALALIGSFGVFTLLVEAIVFSKYFYHMYFGLLQMTFSGEIFTVLDLSPYEFMFIFAIFLALVGIEIALAWTLWRVSKRFNRLFALFMGLTILCLSLTQVGFVWATVTNRQKILQAAHVLPLFAGMKMDRTLIKYKIISGQSLLKNYQQKNQANNRLQYPLHAIQTSSTKKPLNVVVIGIDAWRFDALTAAITPKIYELSKQAIRFNDHYSGGDCTKAGLFALFYSLPAYYWDHMHAPPVLFEELKKHNYQTKVLVSAGLIWPSFYQNIFKNVKNLDLHIPGKKPFERDKNINAKALNFLDSVKQKKDPFFLFLFYDSAHGYSLPPHFVEKFTPSTNHLNRLAYNNSTDPEPLLNRYKNSLYFVDGLVGEILAKLKTLDLYKDTVIIFTTDHGEEFNDNHNNAWGHSSNFTQYQIKIPLVILWPGKKPDEINYKTTSYDLVPTLMQEIFNVTNPVLDYSMGDTLLKKHAVNYIFSSSYEFSGVVTPNQIVYFYPGNILLVTDLNGNRLPNKVSPDLMKWYLATISRFNPTPSS